MAILLKFIYRFNIISIKIPDDFIAEIDKLRIEKNFSHGDIAKIIRNVPDGMTADDIINLFV